MAPQDHPVIQFWTDLGWMLPGGHSPTTAVRPDAGAFVRPIGRFMVGVGVLVLLFAVYQLWGTGLVERNAQRSLEAELAATLTPITPSVDVPIFRRPTSGAAATDFSPVIESAAGPVLVPIPVPTEGEAIARLELPSIGVSKAVVQGVQRDTLRKAPGHYPSSALPGEGGNVAIAGHRTTHGAPFFDLDQLAPGDEVTLETVDGTFTYEVQGHDGPDGDRVGHVIVDPSAVEVISNQGDDRLTLTACHPKFSARQRIVVSALLIDGPTSEPVLSEPVTTAVDTITATPNAPTPVPVPNLPVTTSEIDGRAVVSGASSVPHPSAPVTSPPAPEPLIEDSLGWQGSELDPTLLWATVCSLIAFAGWIGGRVWPRRAVYAATTPIASVPLVLFYFHLERMLPAF